MQHYRRSERLAGPRAAAVLIEDVGYLGVGVIVEQAVQGVGHQTVVGIDPKVSPAGKLRSVTRPLHMGRSQCVCLIGSCFEVGLDAEGHFESDRGDAFEEEPTDRCVDAGARNTLTRSVCDGSSHAEVLGYLNTSPGVIAERHAAPAAPAHSEALGQRRASLCGTGAMLGPVRLGIGG